MSNITRTVAIKGKEGDQVFTVTELDFTNIVCDLEGQGIDIMSMMNGGIDRSKIMTITRALLAVLIDVPVKEAGKLLTMHMSNGGAIDDIFEVFSEAMTDAGFGNRPAQDHKKPATTVAKGRKTTKK